jgi:uncharacterized membrane protein YGL010W
MDDSIDSHSDLRRPVDRYLGNYSEDHRNPTNKLIHWVCVPVIVWTVLALAWVIPVPAGLGRPGLWAGLAMVAAIAFYLRLSRPLALAMLVVFVALGALTHLLYGMLGPRGLLITAIAVFVLAWIAQFIGHHIEGKRPSFLTDIAYLLIGPLWLMAHVFRRVGWRY